MSRARLFAASVVRVALRHDAMPASARCPPMEGENLLDTPLGVARGSLHLPLMAITEPEPDLSAWYRLPSRPAEPVSQARAGHALARALQGLDLDRDAFRLLAWADGWSAADRSAPAAPIESAPDRGRCPVSLFVTAAAAYGRSGGGRRQSAPTAWVMSVTSRG